MPRRTALLQAAAALSVLTAPAERASASIFWRNANPSGFGAARSLLLNSQLEAAMLTSPTRFGGKQALSYYTAETLLLSLLPVQCPPLDALQKEAEQIYVLRSSLNSSLSMTAASYDWSKLEKARVEALNVTLESMPLFKLFFDRSTLKKGMKALDELEELLRGLEAPLEQKNIAATLALQTRVMRELVNLGNLAVPEFPYTVCKATYCEGRPRLLGRATVEMMIARANATAFDGSSGYVRLTAMLDGYGAPISAGNFVDLVKRGFFNGLPFSRGGSRLPAGVVGSGAVVSSGQPADLGGNVTGFVDPRTGQYRTIPLEILPANTASGPVYCPPGTYCPPEGMGSSYALPFRAKGSMGMVHTPGTPDDGASEFFVLTEDVAAGSPVAAELDGQYALFGFVLEGVELLPTLGPGDTIVSAKVISGAENVRRPDFNPTYQGRSSGNVKRDYQMLGGEGLGSYESTLPADLPLAPEDAAGLERLPDKATDEGDGES